MGIEYEIRFQYDNPDQLDALLRQAPYFTDCNEDYRLYNYRDPDNPPTSELNDVPDVHAAIEPYGIYVCDNGGAREVARQVLDYVQRATTQTFGSIETTEL
jgi:hypothetical protein